MDTADVATTFAAAVTLPVPFCPERVAFWSIVATLVVTSMASSAVVIGFVVVVVIPTPYYTSVGLSSRVT
jgi:hypothetical protein